MYYAYLLISSVLLCVGYLAYKWIPAREHQHALNRLTIYSIYILALILPVLLLWGPWNVPMSEASPSIEIGATMSGLLEDRAPSDSPHTVWIKWIGFSIAVIYITGVIVCTFHTLYGFIYLRRIIGKGERRKGDKYDLVILSNKGIAPFSWLRYIVIQEEDFQQFGELIIAHESSHLRLRHWMDLLFSQLVCIMQWFNPAAWLLRDEFRAVHEYQADEAVISKGVDLRSYQTMLIKKAVGMRFDSLANSLSHSKLKKRVTMMYKEKTSGLRRFGALILVPAMAAGCALFEIPAVARVVDAASEIHADIFGDKVNENSVDSEILNESVSTENIYSPEATREKTDNPFADDRREDSNGSVDLPFTGSVDSRMPEPADTPSGSEAQAAEGEKVYTAVEESAQFPGGMKALMQWLGANIEYPQEAIDKDEEGRVIVKFVIGVDGKVSNPEVVKGVSPSLDKEAIRAVGSMPDWTPAKCDGKSVASWFTIPVSFKLPKEPSSEEAK